VGNLLILNLDDHLLSWTCFSDFWNTLMIRKYEKPATSCNILRDAPRHSRYGTGPVALHINVDTEEFPTSAIPDFWRQRQPILKETAMAGGLGVMFFTMTTRLTRC
jgi:hypothetical protein